MFGSSDERCPECGDAIEHGDNFCMNCGADLRASAAENPNEAATERRELTRQENGSQWIAPEHGAYVTPARVSKVSDILDSDERVHYLTRGGTIDVEGSSAGNSLFGNDRSRKSGTSGWVRAAVTDRRIVVKIPQFLGNDERSIPYDSITSVDLDTGLVNKRLSLQTAGQTYHIQVTEPDKAETRETVKFIRGKISQAKERHAGGSPAEPDPTEQLKNIKELHDQGVLTDEEFAEKKQSLLDKI